MKIDLHCHTKNCKKGDVNRDVSPLVFAKKITSAAVRIVAITNHNVFDRSQFDLLVSAVDSDVQVWPGIELDVSRIVDKETHHGHIILITDPKNLNSFSLNVSKYCLGKPDDICLDIDKLIDLANSLPTCIVSCHYRKSPHLSIDDIRYMEAKIKEESTIVLEPSNSRKAGVIINSDCENCWYGSDVEDWNDYPGKDLPDCLFNVSCFQQFIDLLKKNQKSVLLKTFLSVKGPESINIEPFSDLSLCISLYQDTNIVFGGKATGKTIILEKIEEALKAEGKSVKSFYIEKKSDDIISLADYRPTEDDLNIFAHKSCSKDFTLISKWNWNSIPTLSDFYESEKSSESIKILNHLKIIESSFPDMINDNLVSLEKIELDVDLKKINDVKTIKGVSLLSDDEKKCLFSSLSILSLKILERFFSTIFDNESKKLEKFTIGYFSKSFALEQGTKAKPVSCGLTQTFSDYCLAKQCINNIGNNLKFESSLPDVLIGELPIKGKVFRKTRIGFVPQKQSKNKNWLKRQFLDDKTTLDDYKKLNTKIKNAIVAENSIKLVGQIEELKTFFAENNLSSLDHFKNYSNFLINGENDDFKPSNGEASILLVDSAVRCTKCDVIILDEPDSGMGSDFINNELLPRIKERASENKIIVISTHDPNLVVRTHPYMCIYREESDPGKYKTFFGSSFEDLMRNPNDLNDTRGWIDECINKCEGGDKALNERERTYGNYR